MKGKTGSHENRSSSKTFRYSSVRLLLLRKNSLDKLFIFSSEVLWCEKNSRKDEAPLTKNHVF